MSNLKVKLIIFIYVFFIVQGLFISSATYASISLSSYVEDIPSDTEVFLESYLILRTSDITNEENNYTGAQKDTILICDSDFKTASIECDTNAVINAPQKSILTRYGGKDYFIGLVKNEEFLTLVIPRNSLNSPALTSALFDLIKSLNFSKIQQAKTTEPANSIQDKLIEDTLLAEEEQVDILKNLFLFFFISVLVSSFLAKFKKLFPIYLASLQKRIFLERSTKILTLRLFTLFLIFMTALFLLTVMVLDRGDLDFPYIETYVYDTYRFNYPLLNTKSVIFISVTLVLICSFLEFIYTLIERRAYRLKEIIDLKDPKKLLNLILFSYVAVLLVWGVFSSGNLLYFLGVFLLILTFFAKLSSDVLVSKSVLLKSLTFIALVTILLSALEFRRQRTEIGTTLFDDSAIVVTPIIKTIASNEHVVSTRLAPSGLLFMSDVLLASNAHNVIYNRNYKDFSDTPHDIIITKYNSPSARHMIIKNPMVINKISSQVPTNLISLTNIDTSYLKDIFVLKLKLSCVDARNSKDLKFVYFYDTMGQLEVKEEKIANLASCSNANTSSLTIEVPISFMESRKFETLLIEILGINSSDILEMQITQNDKVIPFNYLKSSNLTKDAFFIDNNSEQINVYSDVKSVISKIEKLQGSFDVSTPVNEYIVATNKDSTLRFDGIDIITFIRNKHIE